MNRGLSSLSPVSDFSGRACLGSANTSVNFPRNVYQYAHASDVPYCDYRGGFNGTMQYLPPPILTEIENPNLTYSISSLSKRYSDRLDVCMPNKAPQITSTGNFIPASPCFLVPRTSSSHVSSPLAIPYPAAENSFLSNLHGCKFNEAVVTAYPNYLCPQTLPFASSRSQILIEQRPAVISSRAANLMDDGLCEPKSNTVFPNRVSLGLRSSNCDYELLTSKTHCHASNCQSLKSSEDTRCVSPENLSYLFSGLFSS